ncbi:hypothetical protein Y1Q_0008162 [Alligator mississippiensis]|uniref:Uncharacterized protein n=1 Tax=Alligator mississippiensis TaxID=8496 RepID=A0A151N122_ALLMI|nr:hypothetical protein Y1Q_0008162 [Alligator mississippiensis]
MASLVGTVDEAFLMTPENLLTSTPEGSVFMDKKFKDYTFIAHNAKGYNKVIAKGYRVAQIYEVWHFAEMLVKGSNVLHLIRSLAFC